MNAQSTKVEVLWSPNKEEDFATYGTELKLYNIQVHPEVSNEHLIRKSNPALIRGNPLMVVLYDIKFPKPYSAGRFIHGSSPR